MSNDISLVLLIDRKLNNRILFVCVVDYKNILAYYIRCVVYSGWRRFGLFCFCFFECEDSADGPAYPYISVYSFISIQFSGGM